MKVKVSIPGIKEFDAEFTDDSHLNQFRKYHTIIGGGNAMINGVVLRPGITVDDILNPKKEPNY